MALKITVEDTGNSSKEARTLSQSILNLIGVTECVDFSYTYRPAQSVTVTIKDPAMDVAAAQETLRRAQEAMTFTRR